MRLTAAALRDYAVQAALGLRAEGVRPGHAVGVDLPVELDAVVTLALLHEGAAGARVTGLPASSLEPFDRLVVADPALARDPRAIVIDDAWPARAAERPAAPDPLGFAGPGSLCRVIYSSGTTGRPRGVPITAGHMVQRLLVGPQEWAPAMPMFTIIGQGSASGQMTMLHSWGSGQPGLLPGTAAENVAIAREMAAAVIAGSPAQLSAFLDAHDADPRPLPALRVVQCGGHHLPPRLAERLRRSLGVRVVSMYGSTEVGIATRIEVGPLDVSVRLPGDAATADLGHPFPAMRVEAVDEAGRPLPAGRLGWLRFRRPGQPDHDWHDPEASEAAFRDGWFYPGDQGSIAADGRVLLAGRESEVINASGVKVDPWVLDLAAREEADVLDAAAFGVRTADALTAVGLAVVLAPGADRETLSARLAARIPQVRPLFVVPLPVVPRTDTGKPQRHRLAQEYDGRLG